MAITKEQVFTAADELAATGLRPTLEAIRQRTGGSFTTLAPLLKAWRADRTTAGTTLREPAPQAVTDRLAALGADVWAVALDLATARLDAERKALETARADMEAERGEAVQLSDTLAAQVDDLQSRLANASNEANELRGQLAAATGLARTTEARCVEIERRATELRTELDRAHQDADLARAALAEQSQAAAEQLEQVRAKAEADREQAAAEVRRMDARLSTAQDERDQAAKDAAQAREDAARLAGQLQAHQEQVAALLARIGPARGKGPGPGAAQR